MINKYFLFIYFLIIFFVSFSLEWLNIVFLPLSFVVIVILFLDKGRSEKRINIKKILIIIPIIVFFVSRLFPFLSSPHPLGYDTGFYNYNIEKEREVIEEKKNLLNPITQRENVFKGEGGIDKKMNILEVESLGARYINRVFIYLGFSNWMILYIFYIFMCFLAGILIFLLSKKYFNIQSAYISLFLYSVSVVQFYAYWELLWKHAVGLNIILLCLLLLENGKQRNFLICLLLFVFTIFTHKTSAFILLIILFLYLIKDFRKKIFLNTLFFIICAIGAFIFKDLLIYIYKQSITGFQAYYDFFSIKEGMFIGIIEYLKKSFYYLPFGIIGFWLSIKRLNKKIIIIPFSLILIILIAIKFIFYKRLLIYLDIMVIIFASIAIFDFLNVCKEKIKNRVLYYLVLMLFILFPIFLLAYEVMEKRPLIDKNSINKIREINLVLSDVKLFTYNSYYTPWLYGFSGHKIIAPGWGDKEWNYEQWKIFWNVNNDEKKKMLNNIDEPLLIMNNEGMFLEGVLGEKVGDFFVYYEN
jgi:hypothetical protein